MIICICKNVSEKEIRNAICNGCSRFEDLQIELGVCVQCEKCETAIKDLVKNTLDKK